MSDPTRVYGGVAAGQRRTERRDRLVAAAFELLARDGTQGLTIRKIASAAGVSTRYVYEDFNNLEDLRCQAFDSAAEEVGTRAVEAAAGAPAGDARQQVTAVLSALFDFAAAQPAKAQLLLTDAYGDPVLASRRMRMSEIFAEGFSFYVREYLPAGISATSIELTARSIVGVVAEMARALASGSLPVDHQTLVDHQVEFVLGAIEGISSRSQ